MTNKELILERIKKSGLKKKYIAEKLGISYNSLVNKINGDTDFTASQVNNFCKLLNITSLKEKEEIFFACRVD